MDDIVELIKEFKKFDRDYLLGFLLGAQGDGCIALPLNWKDWSDEDLAKKCAEAIINATTKILVGQTLPSEKIKHTLH
jgi:hypothetical protein